MIQWDLKIVRQKVIHREYLEYLLIRIMDDNPYWLPGTKTGIPDIIPPAPFRLKSGPLPVESSADMFNYLRKTHTLREPVINCKRVSHLVSDKGSLRNRLIVTLLTGTSLTIRQIAALKVSDLLPGQRKILLPRKAESCRSRDILLSGKLTALFKILTAGRDGGENLFCTFSGKPLKPSTLQAIYSRSLKNAGL
jgi:hypothetical protein